jgi:hypothetical protein
VGENFGGIIRVFVGAAGKTNSDSLPPIGDWASIWNSW